LFFKINILKMGLVNTEIELVNAIDSGLSKRNLIGKEEIRRMPVTLLVDTGAIMLVINEEIRDYLGLDAIEGKRLSRMADGTRIELEVVGPVEVHYQGRICITNALVLPGDAEPLLGAIPMEELDLIVHPASQTVAPAHPEGQVMMLK
jgi:clan AA aspartic protease